MSIRASTLRSLPRFTDFPETAVSSIAGTCIPRTFNKSQNIYFSGQEKGKFYILMSGEVEIYRTGEGKRVVIHLLLPGDFFGDLAFTDHDAPVGGSHARARKQTNVCVISSKDLKNLLTKFPVFAILLLTSLRDRLHHTEGKVKDLALSSAETRIINELIRHIARFGKERADFYEIEEKLTHQSLADMIGVARETATRVLGVLEKAGVISWSSSGFLRLHHAEAMKVCPHCLMMKEKMNKTQWGFRV